MLFWCSVSAHIQLTRKSQWKRRRARKRPERSSCTLGQGGLQCPEHPSGSTTEPCVPTSVPEPTPSLQLSASLLSRLVTRTRQVAPITQLSEQTSGLRLTVPRLLCQKHSMIDIGKCIVQQQLFKHRPSTTAACFPPSGWQSRHFLLHQEG